MSQSSKALHIRRLTAKYARWLHIYGSMGSFAVVFFFAVTGLTLNHPLWFANQQRTATMKGVMETSWTNTSSDDRVGKLEIVEYLRKTHGIEGALDDFRIEAAECDLAFKGAGYSADVLIDRATGRYEVTESRLGFAAIINDLHKGRDTGRVWKWFIDLSAVLLTFVSATGLVLIWFVHRHRVAGLLSLAAGCVLTYLLYVIFVP